MLAVGSNELTSPLGSHVHCWLCGATHPVEYGDRVNEDGTRSPSKLLAFFKCKGVTYLCGINGKAFTPKTGGEDGC